MKMIHRTLSVGGCFALVALVTGACVATPESEEEGQEAAGPRVDFHILERGTGPLVVGVGEVGEAKAPGADLGVSSISYHGGPIMTGTTHAYIIWYGNWSGNTATTIVPAFLSNIGGSSYFNINTTYYNS